MAHQNKFVSVNLNRSYGQPRSSSSSGFGNGRARPGAAGGGGMVVLSRPRSSGSAGQKGPSKLSVPPPLNLPSLRKEHERLDPSSVPGSSARPGSSGFGSGTGSSTTGWTKPGFPPLFQDTDGRAGGQASPGRSSYQQAGSPYMPPAARVVGQPMPPSSPALAVEKAVVLRGEDFPSLRATVPSGPKQKDPLNQKQKHLREEASNGKIERPGLQSPLDMRPQMKSSRLNTSSLPERDVGSSRQPGAPEQLRKQNGYFPGPLPLIQLSHTSNWADDERDTGLSIPERARDHGFSRNDSTRVRDFSDGRGARDVEGSSVPSREFLRGDSFRRDFTAPSKGGQDASSWRTPQPRGGFDRDRAGVKPFGVSREMSKDSNYGHHLLHVDYARDSFSNDAQAMRYTRRDLSSETSIQNGKNLADTSNVRAADQNMRGRYGDLSNNRYRGDSFQNGTISKSPFSSGSKGFSLNDPILKFGRENRTISSSGKMYLEDAGLHSNDPFSGGLIGEVHIKVLRRKKDGLKEDDFHDFARESFEAEIERVQRMQELERQRIIDEQARALELARREQEERARKVREEEERRRRLEEEEREAAWKEEQEKLEAAKRTEEQKIAREEEKRRILMEEERRKDSARQKLLELEARIAKRQAEFNVRDDGLPSSVGEQRVPGSVKERDFLRVADIGEWEDGERMVEHVTSTASSDSSNMKRYFDTGSKPHSSTDGNSILVDKGKHANNWRRDTHGNGNNSMFLLHEQESDYHSSRHDAFNSGRVFSRKEVYGNLGASVRLSSSGGASEPLQVPNDFRHPRGNRWNIGGDGEYFNRNSDINPEFLDNDKSGDGAWGPGRSRGSPHGPHAERSYQNSEFEEFTSSGRSRYSLRQPRVLPPPSMTSMHKSSFRAATERPHSSSVLDSEMGYQYAGRTEEASYDRAYQEKFQGLETTSLAENTIPSEQKEDTKSLRCDSQSSLSVSSPPTSPTHLSHDDLDESEDSQALPNSAVRDQAVLSDNEPNMSALEVGNTIIMVTSSSGSNGEDDEWTTDNHETMPEQEVYDEDDNGYLEEEEAHEGNGENLDQGLQFEDTRSDVLDTSQVDQMVLGFDEGVEVKLPISDEVEKTARNIDTTVGVQACFVSCAQELISSDGHWLAKNASPEETANESSRTINETEEALQDLVIDPVAPTNYTADSVEATSSSGVTTQQIVSSALSSPLSSTFPIQPILSSVSSVVSQPEVPIKLQFGLFSGPSLIPSPVPAIQVGSIQMPLHLHPQIGPSVPQMHSSQPPFFQFGQLRYTSPISQGILPLAPMSFVQPPASAHYSLHQNLGGSVLNHTAQESSSMNYSGDQVTSSPLPIDKQPGLVTEFFDLSQENIQCRHMNALPGPPKNGAQSLTSSSSFGEVSVSQTECHGIRDVALRKNYRPVASNKESQSYAEQSSSQFFSKAPGVVSGSRGKRIAYTVRSAGTRSSLLGPETSHTDLSGFQRRPRTNTRRTEFRVRENFGRRQTETVESFNSTGQGGKPNFNVRVSGNSARYGGKKDAVLCKSTKIIESENLNSGAHSSRVVISDGKMDKVSGKDDVASKKRMSSLENSHAGEVNMKRNGSSEDDVDAPLQSGVVRVFKQPGIEAPSDEDDFIQVRSKRQMLNDRREQREKEIKAKSRVLKEPRRHVVPRSNGATSKSNRAVASLGGDAQCDSVISDGRGFANVEASPVFTANVTSQSLPPIGTPALNVVLDTKSKSFKSSQTSSASAISSSGTKFIQDLSFENRNGLYDNASMPLGSWGNADINQQVMALTQSQLDEAMQAARFDSHAASSIAYEPNKSPSSIMMQEKSFSSSASSLNSLLAGEKIQFGAVTSPTILPPVSRSLSNGIGSPRSGRSDVAMTPKLPSAENESCAHLEDSEAEAEAAASAVAVAAISNNDEIIVNMLGACSVSVSDPKSLCVSDATMLTSGGLTTGQEVTGRSAAEESLSVSLPADLSVDTPSLPLWPPLPSPQGSSGPMLSHFPAVPPSHFPCFEMNPMLGGPIFAFGPHDESAGNQPQPQRSTTLGSGPLGPWPQYHSSGDSFYGPPAGYTGPFMSPPGGIPGVQGPPHMVVYNHFTPVGQFGQVGLGFMGTTYIPTGKPPDWKHNPVSSAVGVSEGDIGNLHVSAHRSPPSMTTTIQHMAPGSPIMPMASPLTMFDMSPFQSSADVPVQARWSHMPPPPIHSVPLSMQQQQQQHQVDGMPSQFWRSMPVDTSAGNNRFNEPRSSSAADGNRVLSAPKNDASKFPDELGLVEPAASTNSVQRIALKISESSARNASETVGTTSDYSGGQTVGSPIKPQAPQQPTSSGQQYLHPIGYSDHRGGGAPQKTGSGGEWHHRMGYQGRNQSSAPDKNFVSSKVKKMYVAKSPTSGNIATG